MSEITVWPPHLPWRQQDQTVQSQMSTSALWLVCETQMTSPAQLCRAVPTHLSCPRSLLSHRLTFRQPLSPGPGVRVVHQPPHHIHLLTFTNTSHAVPLTCKENSLLRMVWVTQRVKNLSEWVGIFSWKVLLRSYECCNEISGGNHVTRRVIKPKRGTT